MSPLLRAISYQWSAVIFVDPTAFPRVYVGTGFESSARIQGKTMNGGTPDFILQFGPRYFASVDLHRSKRTKSFQFGIKSQIAAHHSVYREGQRILNFKNCFPKSDFKKICSEDTQYSKNLYLIFKKKHPGFTHGVLKNTEIKTANYFLTCAVCLIMLENASAFRLAPPTRPPSISGCLISSVILSAVTLPP